MSEQKEEVNWKEIAMQLAQRVNFAVQNCKAAGGLFNTETGQITPWREYMVEAMEMIPGVKVDREILATMDMPQAKRRKEQARILAARKGTGSAA